MNCAVFIRCLVVVAVLGVVTSLPEQQLEMENRSENKDIMSILLDDHLRKHGSTCGRTKLVCRRSGGKCQSKTVPCEGEILTGRQYCFKSKNCGCCVPPATPTPKGCVFGDCSYPHGDIIQDTCMQLVCLSGDWNYIRPIHHRCGECIVHGDPHIALYSSTNPGSYVHTYGGTGSYAISQPGFKEKPLFGVNSNFEECGLGISCVRTATYFEPDINVTMILPSLDLTDYCNGNNGQTDPLCIIKVFVNGEERTMDKSVKSFWGTDGTVLVFKDNHISSSEDLNCINVVGSQGFSVSLCQHQHDYAWIYVWAMPSLKNHIYGLCDTFPGNYSEYTTRDESKTDNYYVSADSWKIGKNSVIILRQSSDDRCTNTTVASEIEDNCNTTARYFSPHTTIFYDSCVYDLCRVSNPDRYLEGYASHALVHRQISVSSSKCNCTFRESLVGLVPPYYGCVITEAAPANSSCNCSLIDIAILPLGIPIFCWGNVADCKDPLSPYCITPGSGLLSCEQGQGNCGGYPMWT